MNSLQAWLLSALIVICASNPIPQEAVSSTVAPAVPNATPAVKTVPDQPVVPGVAGVTEVPKSLDNEKIPEPQALPSKKEEAAPAKTEEKKREAPEVPAAVPAVKAGEQPAVEPQPPVAQPVAQPEQVTGKVLPEPTKPAAAEISTPKVDQKPAESVKSTEPTQKPAEQKPTPAAATAAAPAVKQADVKQAVESTVVPVVPAAIASEKKIDAGL